MNPDDDDALDIGDDDDCQPLDWEGYDYWDYGQSDDPH